MLVGLTLIVVMMAAFAILERLRPDVKLNPVRGWWVRVALANIAQLFIVILAALTYERWMGNGPSVFRLRDHVSPFVGGFIGYLVNTWLFYWWHRSRHEIYWLWVCVHQIHHSAERIEVATSFYKHPLEILADSVLMATLLYPFLGLSSESSVWLSAFSAFGEFFYHMNVATPRWIGYFFQRPEMHRIHHLRNKRFCFNYSDLPIWDILGGTFFNPESMSEATGYVEADEVRLLEMLIFRDVLRSPEPSGGGSGPRPKPKAKLTMHRLFQDKLIPIALISIGLLQPFGYLCSSPAIKGLGYVSVASPLPLVFSSFRGHETFSSAITLTIEFQNTFGFCGSSLGLERGRLHGADSPCDPQYSDEQDLVCGGFQPFNVTTFVTPQTYSSLSGPYNRRNAYGVLFSHGPYFDDPQLIKLRDRAIEFGFCRKRVLPSAVRDPLDLSIFDTVSLGIGDSCSSDFQDRVLEVSKVVIRSRSRRTGTEYVNTVRCE